MASILGRLRDRFAGSDEVDPVVAALRDALADDRVKVDGAQRALLSHDASVFEGGNPGPVCYPETTDEVVAIMKIATEHGIAVVPRGAGTGLLLRWSRSLHFGRIASTLPVGLRKSAADEIVCNTAMVDGKLATARPRVCLCG